MDDFSQDFGPFEGRIWMNCAHQGPLPRVAADAAREAIAWKVAPFEMTQERFDGVPARLREALARLLGATVDEIVLGNSASYGLHLLANGLPWRAGDEVLVVDGDFPSDVLPWLGLERRGVTVRRLRPAQPLPDPDELRQALSPATRLFCTTWVHSFSGFAADLAGLGAVCRERGVLLVANTSQALGARTLDVRSVPVDAVVNVGFKWLCGPYGTGLAWIRPDLIASLEYNQAYWLAQMTAADLGRERGEGGELRLPPGPPTARTYDVFGTANFFNYTAWTAAVEYLLAQGLERIARHDEGLVERLVGGLDRSHYALLSPREGASRSTLVFVSHRDPARNAGIHRRLKQAGVEVSYRQGKLRLAPHLHNTPADVDRVLAALHEAGAG
ncbi:MAG: aminotransferase class V-fold PLP-dependent enzyme [Chloroflexi bacterium]|nr:MAG: aminotransferase class V-fold PLP-dependent enzyme [Chloroflexota bacterium]